MDDAMTTMEAMPSATLPAASRDLDARLHEMFVAPVYQCDGRPMSLPAMTPVPHYTSSLEAATALCTLILPTWMWSCTGTYAHDRVVLDPDFDVPGYGNLMIDIYGFSHDFDRDGPGVSILSAPSGRMAGVLCAALVSVMEGLSDDRPPVRDAGALCAIADGGGIYPAMKARIDAAALRQAAMDMAESALEART